MARKKKTSWTPFVVAVSILVVIGLFVYMNSDINLEIDPQEYAYTDDEFDRPNAEYSLVEYGDFQCPACGQFAPLLKQVKNEFENVDVEFRHFVLGSFPYSQQAAEASECARNQNRFWAYHDLLFEYQSRITPSFLYTVAEAIELDMDEFTTCLEERQTQIDVVEDINQARENNVSATPWVTIDGERVQYSTINQFRAHFSE